MNKTSIDKTKKYLAGWNISSKWADHAQVTENPKHKGIELLFNNEPSHELQSKLRAIGFRPSKVKNMWYAANNASTKAFAQDVQSAISSSVAGPDLFLSPPFEATRTNIEKKEFSFILITLKDGQLKNYIIFEPSKPKAEVMATQFARQEFGDDFIALAAKPRTQLREARMLFDEGKIIFPNGQQTIEKNPVKVPSLVSAKLPNTGSIETVHFPEQKEIIEQFKATAFTIPFSAQEAFDKNLPVIDLAFRYAPAMEYFKDKIEIPFQKQIKGLQQELKNLSSTKDQQEKRNALKDKIKSLETEIRFAEKLVQDENLIFQDDVFNIILEKARQERYVETILTDLIRFREYMLEHIFDNRVIENYHKDPIQKVVGELLDEYIGSTKENANSETQLQQSPNPSWEINLEAHKDIRNSLANEHGVYTADTAGDSYERITIPMPKAAQYEAEIRIVKEMDGRFAIGIWASKKFGDYSGMSYGPSMTDTHYRTRAEALTAALHVHLLRLEQLKNAKDSTLNNEEKKNKQLNAALNALRDFAKANDLSLDKKDTTVISGLEPAYWTEKDDVRPLNKAMINGILFHQKRLIQLIGDRLEKLPLPVLENIVRELSEKFEERKPLSTYEEKYVTPGKEGDVRKAALIVMYVDDLIFRTDLLTIGSYPVLTFLIELLFSDSPKLADFPQHIEKHPAPKIKKQSQHELNKEIEALIDRKDQKKSFFNEEEKMMLRQYSGSGGLIKQGATGKGILYEYYTPDTIIKKMWDLAYHFGYDGGSVLEPSVGTGNFLKYGPKGSIIVGYEVNHYAARIAQILYPAAQIHEAAFETIFFAGNVHLKDDFSDTRYSLVIGNPPYGDFSGRYAGMGEKKWTGAFKYEQYFTLRGLDLLKSGGLLIYIVPSNFPDFTGIAIKIAAKCTGLDRYYLGTGIFKTTDIETDIIVLRKN